MNNLCPLCKTSYPQNVKFCINDGARLIEADTPQNVENPMGINNPFESKPITNLGYVKADLGNRFLAALLDALICFALAIPGTTLLVFAFIAAYGNEETLMFTLGIIGALLFFIPIAYQLLKDGFGQGQSYGKKALKLLVIDLETNRPITKSKSFLRNIVSLLLGIVPLIGNFIEPVMILATDDGRKLGDRAANTMVIDRKSYFN
ncbi:RDD family protein [Pedobacter heparinus]|uniref:RDD family protein n=1 Tax=Pedobacter heparinus TaxID=984 RepID=UPI00293064E1|nr:RDD family protein [Pedobacter heparinus]